MKIGPIHIIVNFVTDKKLKQLNKDILDERKKQEYKQGLDNKVTAILLHENTALKVKLGIIDE